MTMTRGPIRDLRDAVEFLGALVLPVPRPRAERERVGLGPVRELLDALGNPQDALQVVHIAGSKGKGSTAILVEAIARRAGLVTGLYTSPHLERWTERISVAGVEIAARDFAGVMERLRPHVQNLHERAPGAGPGFFDVLTAAALTHFRDAGVECAIVETGLGGRIDATNVVAPRVTCITSVELEHVDKLGSTLADVAREKSGILKPGVPAIAGRLPEPAREVVESAARRLAAPLTLLGRDLAVELPPVPLGGAPVIVRFGDTVMELPLPGCGAPTAENAALAVACVNAFAGWPGPRLARIARDTFRVTRLPGRMELLGEAPWVMVDGAHTADSVRALAAVLDLIPAAKRRFVVSVTAGKDPGAMLGALFRQGDEVIVTAADASRSIPAPALARALRERVGETVTLRVVDDPAQAFEAARHGLGTDHLLCATGSMYMAGAARSALGTVPR